MNVLHGQYLIYSTFAGLQMDFSLIGKEATVEALNMSSMNLENQTLKTSAAQQRRSLSFKVLSVTEQECVLRRSASLDIQT